MQGFVIRLGEFGNPVDEDEDRIDRKEKDDYRGNEFTLPVQEIRHTAKSATIEEPP